MSDADDWFEKERLHRAAEDGDLSEVGRLVEMGADVNNFDEDLGLTPLAYAARNGSLDVMRFLIESGADVNLHNESVVGETPLGDVADNCSYRVARLLTDHGANPTIPGWMGITALSRASKRKKPEGVRVYRLLLAVAKEKYGYAP